uniref:G-protein coupled receptors family 1 profile domain-containing protein n=1 Tax=Romanomermis culicivorax TaxID=13658 RepID=A0A915JRU3_ROMCU
MIRNLRSRGARRSARKTKTNSENDDEDGDDGPMAARRLQGNGCRLRRLKPARFRPFSSRIRSPTVPKTSSSIQNAKEKILALKDRGLEILMKFKSTQGRSIRKEAKATKLVATVLLVFLLCYVPFFTTNIIKVVKLSDGSWTELMEQIFIVFTWLGYLNSCLNPVIYSIFNQRFREAFKKILCSPLRNSETSSDTVRLRRSGRNETIELCETPKFSGFKSNHLPFTKLNAVADVENLSKFPLSKERRRKERKVLEVLDEEISAAISQHKINFQERQHCKTDEKTNRETTAQRKQIQKASNGRESSVTFSGLDDCSYKIISNSTQLTSFIDEEDEDCSL